MQHSWPNEKTETAAPLPLSNCMLPGSQFDCNLPYRHQCYFCIRNSTWQTIPVPPNHVTLLSPSPAKRVHYEIFSFSLYPFPPESHTNALIGRAQAKCLCPSCRQGGEGMSLLPSNLVWKDNSPNVSRVFKMHWVPENQNKCPQTFVYRMT